MPLDPRDPRIPSPYERINGIVDAIRVHRQKAVEELNETTFRLEQLRADVIAISKQMKQRTANLKAMTIVLFCLSLVNLALIVFWRR
ncbi:MAG: hypothetical protein H7Z11_01050 [Verrucomicrobia bacterium]|nr:hypothetical protein [Leptolyngbya sp. ES-bin-22]